MLVKSDLERIRDILQLQADRNIAGRVMNTIGDGEDLIRCKELVDQAFKRFQVSSMVSTMFRIIFTFLLVLHINQSTAAKYGALSLLYANFVLTFIHSVEMKDTVSSEIGKWYS
jgi:hypothetical protein